jgi:hypothetical protein
VCYTKTMRKSESVNQDHNTHYSRIAHDATECKNSAVTRYMAPRTRKAYGPWVCTKCDMPLTDQPTE